jgi:multiple sugar transport system ATP-binding protein
MASIKLVNISKSFGPVVGVAPQSLNILDGEFMVFLGPSGCGKTTTMRMIAGLIEPTGGQVMIGDNDVTVEPPKNRDVAMVFQNYGLYPHMTVAENIGYPLKVRGIAAAERAKQVKVVADKVELAHLLDRRPSALSGGQRQRVALARAIVRRPKVFLMDEPLSNLDAQLRVTMRAEIKHLQRELGITTIYVTHDQIEAMTLADRIVVMEKGVIQQLGTPEEIYNEPANLFVAGFIGSPPMNLIRGEISSGAFKAPGISLPFPNWRGGDRKDVVFGIRPEDVTIETSGAGHLEGSVYAFELTGDAVLATIAIGEARICARGDRHLRSAMGERLQLRCDFDYIHLFDGKTGERIRDAAAVRPAAPIRAVSTSP